MHIVQLIQSFGESQLNNAFSLLGLLLKYDYLQEVIFRASVWESVFHRLYIQVFGESQLDNAFVLFGLLLKYDCLQKITF